MGKAELADAFSLIERHADQADFEGMKEDALIEKAEKRLGQAFPQTYRLFLKRYGAGDIAGEEFYGLVDDNFESAGIPDAVWLTLDERNASCLPENLVIFYATGEGIYYALDCAQWSDEGECPVVAWHPGMSKPSDALDLIADDFGEFLHRRLKEAL